MIDLAGNVQTTTARDRARDGIDCKRARAQAISTRATPPYPTKPPAPRQPRGESRENLATIPQSDPVSQYDRVPLRERVWPWVCRTHWTAGSTKAGCKKCMTREFDF